MESSVRQDGTISITVGDWPGFSFSGLRPAVEVDGAEAPFSLSQQPADTDGPLTLLYDLAGRVHLRLTLEPAADTLTIRGTLTNVADAPLDLGRLALLETAPQQVSASLGVEPGEVVMLVQSNYWGDVVPLAAPAADAAAAGASEPNEIGAAPEGRTVGSQNVWLAYDRRARQALVAGFLGDEIWTGAISVETDAEGAILRWSLGFDGGDLLLEAGREVAIEGVVLMHGEDPFELLDAYGDAVVQEHPVTPLEEAPVTWCSWYPYRLSVSEDRVLADAAIAARRLCPLGLSIMELDLGWEDGNLPSTFIENERFPHGLAWLAERMGELGIDLGVWKAPYQISEFDPLAQQHPEWMLQGEDGAPISLGMWFWEPHGDVYPLDLTHPGAQEWLRTRVRSLSERGVRYLKTDFIGQAGLQTARRRHDRTIAAGAQTGRIGAAIIAREMAGGLVLNCGGPEMPGSGQWPLLYVCNDTGNTGTQSWQFQRENFRTAACHLWKNRRWGIVQPSCLCVGLPGTLEEARIRATVAFMAGGQVDISDSLTSLPEDRWAVLEATLPPLGVSARAVDLFDPVFEPGTPDYVAQCSGAEQEISPGRPHPPGSVWHLRVERDWDAWDLVALFALDAGEDRCRPIRFRVPFGHLRLDPAAEYWAYEFWSGQFLGTVPAQRRNAGGYEHPGDYQDLVTGDAPGALDVAFAGPATKLICLRPVRRHPWVAGGSFHQGCGAELAGVAWEPGASSLSGTLMRPAGHSGCLILAGADRRPVAAEVDGRPTTVVPSAGGAWRLPLICGDDVTSWCVRFEGP